MIANLAFTRLGEAVDISPIFATKLRNTKVLILELQRLLKSE